MATRSNFEQDCLTRRINWPGTGNDGKTVAERLDERPMPVTEARVRDMIAAIPPGLTEARVKDLIAAAILAQHPDEGGEIDPLPPEVVIGETISLYEDGPPIKLTEAGDDLALTEAAR